MSQGSDLYDTRFAVASGDVTVSGLRGMVSTPHPLASGAGIAVLRAGGNAVDAAVAVSATLGVVEPYMSGPGGIGSMLVHWAPTDEQLALDFNSCFPATYPPAAWSEATLMTGLGAALVPSAVAGWLAAHARFGSLPLTTLFTDAIAYADEGAPLSPKASAFVSRSRERLAADALLERTFVSSRGTSGIVVQPELAATYRAFSEHGSEVFYRGPIAHQIAETERRGGGYLTLSDLAAYEPRWAAPASTTYRGWTVFTMPPPTSGLQILDTLSLLGRFDFQSAAVGAAGYQHLLLECIKAAVDCRRQRLLTAGDPARVTATHASVVAAAAENIRLDRAAPSDGDRLATAPASSVVSSDGRLFTTAFVVADGDGSMVCSTQTLGQLFGAARAYGATGVLANNAAWWSEPSGPLAPRPGGAIESPLAPIMARQPGGSLVGIATPGSNGILQTLPQMLSNLVDRRLPPARAIAEPRVVSFGRRPFMDPWGAEREPTLVGAESRLGDGLVDDLRARGHVVELVGNWSHTMGAGAMVVRDANGVLTGAADPRRDGLAIGW